MVYFKPPLFECFINLRQGLLSRSGVEHWECNSSVDKNQERFIPYVEKGFSKKIKKENLEKSL